MVLSTPSSATSKAGTFHFVILKVKTSAHANRLKYLAHSTTAPETYGLSPVRSGDRVPIELIATDCLGFSGG